MGKGYSFENNLKHRLQELYPSAYIHRFKQSRMSNQDWDLVVIKERDPFFIECKNRNVKGAQTKTLDTLFDTREEGMGQLEKQLHIIERTELDGYLAFEMSRGRGKSKEARLIHLNKVRGHRMDLQEPEIGTDIERDGEVYKPTKEDFKLA